MSLPPEPVALSVQALGEGPPVLVLHGLLGQGRNWASLAKPLAARRRVVLVDLRNHGRSPHDPVMTYAAMAADLLALLDRLGLERASLLGHSMGGKAAMVFALGHPERVARLVVVDVAPVDYGPRPDFECYLRAMLAIDPARFARRAEVEAALAEVAPDPRIRAFLASNLDVRDGRLLWLPNLPVLLAALPAIAGFPAELPPAPASLPVLAIRGARSDYVRAEHEPAFRRLFPALRLETVADAGHWVHADAPAAVLALLEGFLPAG
ncbi:MAG: alpha/beta fold hydrolase [Geminicoccaceae bacterium]|nr:alpha/beta fold hydrolase [Geminicoccaceae bacterium]